MKRHSEKLPAASPSFISMKEMTTFLYLGTSQQLLQHRKPVPLHAEGRGRKYTLDSIAQSNFSGCQTINDMTFSVLCSAMPNDPRITALVEFDFNHNIISVCESSGNAWRTYDLKDVSAAMYKAERKEGLSLDARHEIFAVALEGKEITFDESEDESPDLQM